MTPLREHAFVRQHLDQPQAAGHLSGHQAGRVGVCRRLCATPDRAQYAADDEFNACIHPDAPQPDPTVRGVGTLRWHARDHPHEALIAERVPYDVRDGVATDSATPPLSAQVHLFNGARLDIGAAVLLERPRADPLRCVVVQQLSRVNRYRLRVLEGEITH
jgi:hypothetical protein